MLIDVTLQIETQKLMKKMTFFLKKIRQRPEGRCRTAICKWTFFILFYFLFFCLSFMEVI